MYWPRLDADSGRLVSLEMTPLQLRRMQLVRPSATDGEWLRSTLAAVCKDFGSAVELTGDGP